MDKGSEACQRCDALSARIDGLEILAKERWDRAADRFVSIDKATEIAFKTTKEATDRIAEGYQMAHQIVVDGNAKNTDRLTRLEAQIATKETVKTQNYTQIYSIAALIGIAVSIVTSIVIAFFKH